MDVVQVRLRWIQEVERILHEVQRKLQGLEYSIHDLNVSELLIHQVQALDEVLKSIRLIR